MTGVGVENNVKYDESNQMVKSCTEQSSVDTGVSYSDLITSKNNFYVTDVATGLSSYNKSKQIKGITEAQALEKFAKMGITAHDYAINEPVVNTLKQH